MATSRFARNSEMACAVSYVVYYETSLYRRTEAGLDLMTESGKAARRQIGQCGIAGKTHFDIDAPAR